jgi:hypothetical protein
MEYLNLICPKCNDTFKREKNIIESRRKIYPNRKFFCSNKCNLYFRGSFKFLNCTQCNKKFRRIVSQIKSKNNFCSQSCSATYNNMHKSFGSRRSKLEIWLEEKIKKNYPFLKILFNNKKIINSELDIYIPSLKLAFELNGIYHYEPIHGKQILNRIKNNDNRKFQACLEKNIELCIIDTSKFTYFKEENASIFLDIVKKIINKKLIQY